MQNKIYALFYGSLRSGQYNFDRFNSSYPNGLRKIKTVILTGYKMYSLGSYPACIWTGRAADEVTFDLMEVSEAAYQAIERMEEGAGYQTNVVEHFLTEGNVSTLIKAKVFLFTKTEDLLDSRYPIVESGNWVYYQVPLAVSEEELN